MQTETPEVQTPPAEDSGLEHLVNTRDLSERLADFFGWARTQLSSVDVIIQLVVIAAALLPAVIFGPQLRKFIMSQIAPRAPYGVLRRAANAFAHLAAPIVVYFAWQATSIALSAAGRSNELVKGAVSLMTAWIVVRLVTLVIRSPFWSRVAFYVVWPIAALDAAGLLDEATRYLENVSIPIGASSNGQTTSFSALDLVRVIFIFAGLFWLSSLANRFLKSRIASVDELTPSLQALLIKILDVLLPAAAFILALQIVGFNFATLAIFGGAVGLGIGLGLQRTISNFFAGFTLIADKSIKPGDVVEVGSTFGWVAEMNARYVTVRTRDNKSHLIPNDKFIEDGVINWSHSDRSVRLHAQFGVSYGTRDLRAVKAAAEQTAVSIDRVLKTPSPMCNLVKFDDSSVNFDLRFWINDPSNGVANVTSQVMLALWDRLHEMGVSMPYPQRDIYIKAWPEGLQKPADGG